MAAINDKEQQNLCCEGKTATEFIKEILNDLQNFKAHHEAKKQEFQAKYKLNQVMQIEAQQTEQNEINIQIPQKFNALNKKGKSICVVEADVDTSDSEKQKKIYVEDEVIISGKDDHICCVCTRNSSCKTRLCRCRTNRKLCTSHCRCRKKCVNRKDFR